MNVTATHRRLHSNKSTCKLLQRLARTAVQPHPCHAAAHSRIIRELPKTKKNAANIGWSKTARDLVRANSSISGRDLSALLTRLEEESGNPRWACRRFVRRMEIRWRRPYRTWTKVEQERLIKLIDLHPIHEVAKLMRRSESAYALSAGRKC